MATASDETRIEGPRWDLASEYPSADSAELAADLAELSKLLDAIEALNPALVAALPNAATSSVAAAAPTTAVAQQVFKLSEQAGPLLSNPLTYANCLLSVDARDEAAQVLQGKLQKYQKRYGELLEPWSQYLDLVADDVVEAYLADPGVAVSAFAVKHGRERRHELLGLAEENLVNGLAQDGIHAWGRMYSQLSSTMTCAVQVGNELQTMGVAEANGLLQRADERTRKDAWHGINAAWRVHEESCAAAINAIAGWRLELNRKRSTQRPVHFLDAPVHMNRLSRRTLDTLLDVTRDARPLARRATIAMARASGRERIGPWDMRAPAPKLANSDAPMRFDDAVALIAEAYGEVNPALADFVRMMQRERWIEGTVSSRKRPGAYCTGFEKSRTPRVYMTYHGSASDVITLAHELGHAFHSWVMRDLPDSQRSYGMSLAETASTFGETAVRDALVARAKTPRERFDIMWEEMVAISAFMLNIPARFAFEKTFYEKRDERPLRAAELETMMSDAWQDWYGESCSEPDPMFWASKLHFYISGLSFYNFPYLFGFLFSMGVYLRRAGGGADFYDRYVALLRDTGRMTAEQLALTHLDAALDQPQFWRNTVDRLEPRVAAFEEIVRQVA
ncbi:MAG TPA: M3 family oligoendopeptidase [Pseudomonadales bacterium]|nr:M3 family oligoendopeptidase [Pseudomonadales bacterium]